MIYSKIPPAQHAKCRDQIVRVTDADKNLVCTGLAFGSNGLVLTSGHAFSDPPPVGVLVQFRDGTYSAVSCHLVSCNQISRGLDFALLQLEQCRSFPPLVLSESVELADVPMRMWGFGTKTPGMMIPVDAKFVGPTEIPDTQGTLLLAHAVDGDYRGFSGAPMLVWNGRRGLELAAIQTRRVDWLGGQLLGVPSSSILREMKPELHRHFLASSQVPNTLLPIFSRFTRVFEVKATGTRSTDVALDCVRAIKKHTPLIAGQLSKKQIRNKVNLQLESESKEYVAFVICCRRPKRKEFRRRMAILFGRSRWAGNMYRLMTIAELEAIGQFDPFVMVFRLGGDAK